MPGSTLNRSLIVSALGLAFAATAMAQNTDRQRAPAAKQSTVKPSSAQAARAAKRLDVVPGQSVKDAGTRSTAPNHSHPAQTPDKQGSGCDSQEMDA